MKALSSLHRALATLLCGASLLAGSVLHAQLAYDITINTSSLIGHAAGPFYLDFQLTDGSGMGDANNHATLSNFTFGGGSAFGAPTLVGGATGSLGSSVSLTDSAFFSEFYQGFTPGASLHFKLTLTNAPEIPAPDTFSFAILDSDLFNLPTLAPGTDAFLTIELANPGPQVTVYASNPNLAPFAGGPALAIPAPTIVPVPEPSTYTAFAALALLGLAGLRRLRAKNAA